MRLKLNFCFNDTFVLVHLKAQVKNSEGISDGFHEGTPYQILLGTS